MHIGDLSSGASKMALALKHLLMKWESARETWDDATSRAFSEEHLAPLTPDVKQTLESVGRLAETLARAIRDVSDDGDR
jgi:hypothetical protein